MAGKIKQLIDQIVEQRSAGDETIARTTRTKLVLKGINPSDYTASSADDPSVVQQLRDIANQLGIELRG